MVNGMLDLEPYRAFEFYKTFLKWYCEWYRPSYLEIGCASGELAATLSLSRGVGIDIDPHPDWGTYSIRRPHLSYKQISSDEYFSSICIEPTDQFDLIFIDGDHEEQQVLRDVANSLFHLADGGLIAMHDTYPPTVDYTHPSWSGTAYLAAIQLRQRKDLEVFTFPVTYGLTLVGKIGVEFPWIPQKS